MIRRLIATVALVGCAGIYAFAADERATFILTNGDRKTGTLVHHGGRDVNLIDENLNLGIDGKEQSFAENQVAVIDFAGGQPSANELQSIPASGHFLVLRNGQSQNGQFVNIAHGNTLIWRNASGQEQQYGVSDVARVYLNPQSARVAFNAPAGAAVGTSGSAASAAAPVNPGEIRVDANQAWTDSGLTVKKGDRVAFRAQGQVKFGEGPTQSAGPDGNAELKNPAYPVAVMPVGGLIAKVGNSAPFPIGSNTQPIVMPADGRLMLGINDNELSDNSGYFVVAVNKQR